MLGRLMRSKWQVIRFLQRVRGDASFRWAQVGQIGGTSTALGLETEWWSGVVELGGCGGILF